MMKWCSSEQPPAAPADQHPSSSTRRLSGGSMVAPSWACSRSETERLVRLQAVVRGWLVKRKVCWIPARDLEAVLKDVDQRDKGLRRLVAYLCFFLLFFVILILESDVTFQHAVETGITDFISQVTSGPDGNIRLADVASREDFSAWALSFYLAMYDGTEVEDVCNTCAALRAQAAGTPANYFPEVDESVWGTQVPLGSSSAAGVGNDSFAFEFENCPLCYGPERASIVGAGASEDGSSSIGEDFCGICTGLEYCFEGRCADAFEVVPLLAEAKGTDASLVKVFSNEDCYSHPVFAHNGFPRDFYARVGVTSDVVYVPFMDQAEVMLQPTGRGYVANKNKMIGALLVDWTYYEEGECEDRIDASFYGPCYKDAGSFEDIQQEVQDAVMNTFTGGIEVKEGLADEGLVYTLTTDTGVFNTGLNLNICGMLAVFGGPDVVTDAVRTMSLRFNTYNGQHAGLFSSVGITARFSLGGEVKVETDVEVFSMPKFFDSHADIVCRAIAMFAFALMLARYIAKDLHRLFLEVKDGRRRLSISLRHIPVTTATALNLVGDGVFLCNLWLWVTTAATASTFELIPTLTLSNASEQVRAFSEELALVALERWRRDAWAVAGSLFGLARLFVMLRFHPRLSLVSDVLTASAVHLVHFFIMFFMVVGVFSNVCWVIFGPSSALFATWTASFVTMTRIALGEFDNIYPLMVAINEAAALIIIVTYQTLQGILLLNIVISILLDSFQTMQHRNSAIAADTLRQTISTTLGRWRIRLTSVVLCRDSSNGDDDVHSRGYGHGSDLGDFSTGSQARSPCVGPRSKATSVEIPAHETGKYKTGWTRPRRRPAAGAAAAAAAAAAASPPNAAAAAAAACVPVSPRVLSPGISSGPPAAAAAAGGGLPTTATGFAGMGKGTGKVDIESGRGALAAFRRKGVWKRKGNTGLTRGQRLAVSHRHYDMKTALEVLRRSPLPEAAVRRKMRQIVGARLGWMPT